MQTPKMHRPFVILNSAISLDGKIATYAGDSRMSSPEDLRRVHRLRADVDAIMIGVRTLLVDDPKLTVKFAKNRKPYRLIVDSNARTPLSSYVVRTAQDTPSVIAATSRAPRKKLEALQAAGVHVLVCGSGRQVSLKTLLPHLSKLGIRKILLEGGGSLNWSMLSNGLVDEISVAITPKILGGRDAVTLVEGGGIAHVKNGVKLRLLKTKRYGPDLVVHYKVQN